MVKPAMHKLSMESHNPWKYGFAMDTKTESGRRLKQAREAKRLTLREVCEQVPGLTETALHNWEAGRRMLPIDKAKKLADALGTSAAYLLTLEDHQPDVREHMLVQYFRGTDARGQESILRIAEAQSGYLADPEQASAF